MNAIEHEQRPWGTFYVLEDEPNFKVKRIEVLPGKRLSYQYHHHRAENWVVVQGTATVVLNGETTTLTIGESIFIPLGAKHRLENNETFPLTIIEVQTGDYFGEDDIVRIEDDFNRI